MSSDPAAESALLKTELLHDEMVAGRQTWTVVRGADSGDAGVFEGLYGRVYDSVIRTRHLRRMVFGAWGFADPLLDLDRFVADMTETVGECVANPVIADVPCGAGVLLRLLSPNAFRGTVVEIDLARQMLKRAIEVERKLDLRFKTLFVRSDALALPLKNGSVDAVFSLNGLHVVADHQRFFSELARVMRPYGTLWLISPIDNRASLRSRAILAAASRIDVTPQMPPTAGRLGELASSAGLQELRSYGGESITGRIFRRES